MNKKFISITVLLLLAFNTSYAQMYVRAGLGYGFATSKEVFGTNSTSSSSASSDKLVANTAGSGLQLGAAFGYNFSKNIGLDLGVQYLMGAKQTLTYTNNGQNSTTSETTTSKTNQVRLMPALVISTGGEKIEPYARMGLILPLAGSINTEIKDKTDSDEIIRNIKTTGAFTLGWHSAMGVNYYLSEKMAIFGEVGLQSLSIGAKKSVVTKYTVSGADRLNDLKTIQKEINYVTELTDKSNGSSNSSTDNSKPLDELRSYRQFGNVGINVGIQFGF